MRFLGRLVVFVLGLEVFACSSSQKGPGSDGGTTDASSATDGALATDGAAGIDQTIAVDIASPTEGTDTAASMDATAGACTPSAFTPNAESRAVGTVTATVLDQTGQPVPAQTTFVCGTDLCFPGTTSGTGAVTIAASHTLKAPAFKYGDGILYALVAAPVAAGDSTLASAVTAKLPALGTGDPLAAGASSKSSGVTVDIAAGATVTIDALSFSQPDQQRFRAAALPVDTRVPAVDPTLDLAAAFGVAPAGTSICPPAKVHVANSAHWPAGAAVEFLVHGIDVGQRFAPYGGWAKISDGAVSPDGTEVVTSDGQGFPELDTFGVRLKK